MVTRLFRSVLSIGDQQVFIVALLLMFLTGLSADLSSAFEVTGSRQRVGVSVGVGNVGVVNVPSFVAEHWLMDGERELWIHRNGVTAKETAVDASTLLGSAGGSVTKMTTTQKKKKKKKSKANNNNTKVDDNNNNNNNSTESLRAKIGGIRLWQVTDGRHFIQSIYQSDFSLRDCEFITDKETVDEFVESFTGEFALAIALQDEKFIIEKDEDVDVDDDDDNNYDDKSKSKYSVVLDPISGVKNATMRLLTEEDFDEAASSNPTLNRILDYRRLKAECKALHNRVRRLVWKGKEAAMSRTNSQLTGDADKELTRFKREMFLYPGTNWCGIGSSTQTYNNLGMSAAADRCCRQHDHCPHVIEGFSTKYNLFNYRFHTLSHCECDERFRICLKMVNNAAANMVGKLFFNIVQMRCFVLKGEKTCSRRSWWGKCIKYEMQKTAHLKDALSF